MGKRSAKAAAPKFTGEERFVVLHGDEPYLQRAYLDQFRRAIEAKGEQVDVIRVDGDRAEPGDVFDELRSFGLMSQFKVVVVGSADDFLTRHRELLERYAAAPVDIAALVLRVTKWNKSWKLHKAIAKVGQVVACDDPDRAEATRWLANRAKAEYGTSITNGAATMLVERLGPKLSRLDSELSKLAVAAAPGAAIDKPDVEALVGRSSEEKAWEIQGALLSGDAEQALRELRELVDLAGHPEQFVAYWYADLCRKLAKAAAMAEQRAGDKQICGALKVWPFERQRTFMSAVRKLGRGGSATMLRQVTDLDARAKSGFGDARRNLERFTVQFTAAVR